MYVELQFIFTPNCDTFGKLFSPPKTYAPAQKKISLDYSRGKPTLFRSDGTSPILVGDRIFVKFLGMLWVLCIAQKRSEVIRVRFNSSSLKFPYSPWYLRIFEVNASSNGDQETTRNPLLYISGFSLKQYWLVYGSNN